MSIKKTASSANKVHLKLLSWAIFTTPFIKYYIKGD